MGRTYPNEINRIFNMPGGPIGKECRRLALAIAEEAKQESIRILGKHPGDAPRTGKLANSYQVKVIPGTNKFTVTNPKKYAAAIEKGARPHQIRARRAKVLQFRGRDGVWRRVKVVNHPGSVAHNILFNSAQTVVRRFYGGI